MGDNELSQNNPWWDQNIDPDIAEILIQLNITLSNKVINRDFRPDVRIDYDKLEEDLSTIPSVFAFWSSVLSEQKKKVKTLEIRMDIRKSKFLSKVAENLKEGAKLTRDDKDNLLIVDVEYIEIKTMHLKAEATLSKLFGIVESLKMKSDNLRSLAGFKRAELQGS